MKDRVFIIAQGYSLGGAQRSAHEIALALKQSNFNVEIIAPGNGPLVELLKKDGIKFKQISFSDHTNKTSLTFLSKTLSFNFIKVVKGYLKLAKYIKENRPSLVILNSSTLFLTIFITKILNIPTCTHIREIIPETNLGIRKYLILKVINFGSRKVFVESNFSYKSCVPTISNNKIIKIPNWYYLNKSSEKKLDIDLHNRIITMHGVITESKGIYDLIQAAFILTTEFPNLKFLIIGESNLDKEFISPNDSTQKFKLPSQILASLRDLRLTDNFIFTGPQFDIMPYLQISDICVFIPREPESFGKSLVEAMALGKAIVASNVGPSSEILTDEIHGILIPPKSPKNLADAIKKLILNESLSKKLGENAKDHALKNFSYEQNVKKILECYMAITDNDKK